MARETLRSRLKGEEARDAQQQQQIARIPFDRRLRFAGATSRIRDPWATKASRKTQQANRRRLFSRGRIRIRRCSSIQRQGGRGRIDWPRGHDGFADRTRQSPLAPCDLCSSARKGKCIPAAELRKATQTSVSLRDSLLKFVQAFGVQTTHTAICNAQSRLDVRLARWLLMAHDRIGEDTLTLTHEFLSLMLGVRRPGVTEALHALREQGLISYGRGQITVKDRKGMERTAGEAYGTPEAEYRRLIG